MSKKEKGSLNIPAPEMVRLSDVNMAPYNPRVMSPEQMASLKASLVKHGMVLNLVIQRKGNVLIGGHQRVTAMRSLCAERGWPEPELVSAVLLDVGDREAKQLNVSLNRIEGDFDAFKLGELFASIRGDLTMEDVQATGFSMAEIDQAISLTTPIDEVIAGLERDADMDLGAFARSITLSVEFDTVAERDEAKELLRKITPAKGRPGAALMKALKASSVSSKKKANGKHATAA